MKLSKIIPIVFFTAYIGIFGYKFSPLSSQKTTEVTENLFTVVEQIEHKRATAHPKPTKPIRITIPNYDKNKRCLVKNVFYEGARYYRGKENTKEFEGMQMTEEKLKHHILKERIKIINVTMNRVKSKQYPNTICKVVHQYKQFSWTLEQHKVKRSIKSIHRHIESEMNNLKEIEELVHNHLVQNVPDITGGAVYYHTHWSYPSWRKKKIKVASTLWHKYYKEPS